MTAKQKAARAKFKAVVKEAGKLRKKNPKLTQAQAVKQAWAISYSKERAGVGAVKKKAAKKKAATKVKAKKSKSTEMHTDTKSHNVNIRVMSGWKKGKTKFVEKKEKRPKRNAVLVQRRKTGTFKNFVRIGAMPTYKDPIAAREISLFADNDYQLYNQRKVPILKNLGKKYKKGTFDIDRAADLWRYYIDAAMQKYHKEFGSRGDKWYELLSPSDRQLLALEYAKETKTEFDQGNFTE